MGLYIGSRRELLGSLRNRAERAELRQELRLAQARSTERARIAREMHDVLAHRITQVSMHAGALTFRDDLAGDRLREGLGQIQRQANDALHELRDVLGVLRATTRDRRPRVRSRRTTTSKPSSRRRCRSGWTSPSPTTSTPTRPCRR